jgi:hypothetical protein
MSTEHWMPRPWNAELVGCLWLSRRLDKGRQVLESERQGRDLMNGYLYGDFDYADGKLLKFSARTTRESWNSCAYGTMMKPWHKH